MFYQVGSKVIVLMLHNISPTHMRGCRELFSLLNRRYGFLTPEEFTWYLSGAYTFHGLRFLATFDDGFHSHFLAARQILNELGIRGVFFVTSGFVDLNNGDDRRAFMSLKLFGAGEISIEEGMRNMSWDDVSWLAGQGHQIGSHTRNHVLLSKVGSKAELEDEILGSAYDIEKRIGLKVRSFAYPFGAINSVNTDVLMTAKKQYDLVFSGVRGFNTSQTHPFAIRRDSVRFDKSPAYNYAVSQGFLSILYAKHRARLDSMAEELPLERFHEWQ